MERRLITTREPFAGQIEAPNLEMPVRWHPKSGHLCTKEGETSGSLCSTCRVQGARSTPLSEVEAGEECARHVKTTMTIY